MIQYELICVFLIYEIYDFLFFKVKTKINLLNYSFSNLTKNSKIEIYSNRINLKNKTYRGQNN
jgi:hypothetical protein